MHHVLTIEEHASSLIFIHSFIMSSSLASLQGDYSGVLPISVGPKRKVFRCLLESFILYNIARQACYNDFIQLAPLL